MTSVVHVERLGRLAVGAGLAILLAALVIGLRSGAAAASSATLTLQPSPTAGAYRGGESISVSVGPNSVFAPNARIVIIECAAPGGQLPIDDTACDGNTVQGDSVLVGSDGSFTESSYTLYSLPNSSLNEQANHVPVCDATSQCVLYIGQDQNDFTKPKIFSPAFTLTPTAQTPSPSPGGAGTTTTADNGASGAGTAGAGTAGAGTAGAGTAGAGTASSMSVTLSGGSLAFTGPPIILPWLVGAGTALFLVGAVGGTVARRGVP